MIECKETDNEIVKKDGMKKGEGFRAR